MGMPDHHGFLARRTDDTSVVGIVNISNVVGGALRSGHVGYYRFRGHAHRGLMTEALCLVVGHAFGSMGLHRLEANIQPDNTASIRLAQRCGFRREGYSPRYLLIDGEWRDHERWAIIAP
jgi:ribosomal-protein-alanine N-acetyltransferase